jgi:hypothetical protein
LPGRALYFGGANARGKNRYDDEIFEHTLREFPEFAAAPHTSLIKLDEDWIKSKEGKERWRAFINACVIHTTLQLWLLNREPLSYPLARTRTTDMRGKSQTLILDR